ncbi:hypothetical protein GCM10022421_24150 [Oceanisphaera sediminis]|uniref:DUF6398 domain-containing protein n=1 Tax=Oceanisphaera sediminis TaxID=981381 RepID=A0ABP7E8E7_9GAMM
MEKSAKIPKSMREKYDEITQITDEFAEKYLNDEYAQVISSAVAALCRKRPSPLIKGKTASWACGVTHAIGMVNFLFDNSQQPHIKATDLYQAFGVGQSTGQGKSKQVRDLLKMRQIDPEWNLPSRLITNPLVWMVYIGDTIVDLRFAPREAQEMAYQQGLIPFIPADNSNT